MRNYKGLGLVLFCLFLFSASGRWANAYGRNGLVFTVNSTADMIDKNTGDGVCATTNEVCTLRAAVMEANSFPGWDTIIIPPGLYPIWIPPSGSNDKTGDLDIDTDMTIIGAGSNQVILNANQLHRYFVVTADNFELEGVRITNGRSQGAGVFIANGDTSYAIIKDTLFNLNQGGAVAVAGGNVILENVVIRDNFAVNNGGGAINVWDDEEVTIINSQIYDNYITSDNGVGFGGAILNRGKVTIFDSTIRHNRAVNSTTTGGIHSFGGEVYIYNTLISEHERGALSVSAAVVELENVTLTDNDGVAVRSNNDSVVQIINSTISNNFGSAGSGLTASVMSDGMITIWNSIVANNSTSNCVGNVFSGGGNIDSGSSCNFDEPSDQENTNPLLGPLLNNGGPTMTMALLNGSPAIDTGLNAVCPQTDQRGYLRPIDGDASGTPECDIGAFEFRNFPYKSNLPFLAR